MALSKTLAQLRTALKIRAGMNSTGVSVDLTDAVLNEIINDAVYEGWDVIVGKWLDYFTTTASIAVIAGTSSYAVPTLFYKLRLLEHSDQEKLEPIALEDRHHFHGQTGRPRRYMPVNRLLYVFPTPSTAETLTLWYIPIKAELTADGDTLTFDVPIELKYILAIAWRDVLDRQNLDPSPALQKMAQYEAKLRTAADAVDATEPFYLGKHHSHADHDDDWMP